MSNKKKLSTSTEKPKNTMYVIKGLGKYMLKYKYLLALSLFLTCASNLLSLIGPMLSGYAIDAIEPGLGKVVFTKVFINIGLMIIFYIISSGLSYLLSFIMIRISQNIVRQMRKDVFDNLLDLPVQYFDTTQTGDIISRISYDIDTINTSLSDDTVQILASIITVIGAFSMMIIISPILVLIFIVTIPMSILLTKYLIKRTRPLFSRRSEALGELNGFVEEMITGQKVIKAYQREEEVLEKFDIKNNNAVNAYYNSEYYGSMTGPSVNFINNLSLSLISVFGAILYLTGKMTIGNISSFVLYSRKFSGPINEAANMLTDLQSAFAAAERVFHLIDEIKEPKDSENSEELSDVEGNVEVSQVNFGYSKDKVIVKNLNFKANKGEMIAIVGPTGAGKTTLINLLMRFYDVNSGTIMVDNKDIYSLKRQSLRKAYSMVLQDTWLFSGTIYENLSYGKESTTLEEVIKVAKIVKIHNFIEKLPQGYDTLLTDEGVNISKGQKQLLTIARAMLLDASMLILDEATSNVDTRTEKQIQEAMVKLMEGKTCFVIAHRLSTIRNADKILVVNNGDIIEQGNHKSLMQAKGFYYKLYLSQFE